MLNKIAKYLFFVCFLGYKGPVGPIRREGMRCVVRWVWLTFNVLMHYILNVLISLLDLHTNRLKTTHLTDELHFIVWDQLYSHSETYTSHDTFLLFIVFLTSP